MKRTCMELGICQHSVRNNIPPCVDCEYSLAPGVIDGPFRRRPHASRWRLVRYLLAFVLGLVVLGCVVAVLGFATGYLNVLARMS